MSHISVELTYVDVCNFCEILKPIIGDYHFSKARYLHGSSNILSVWLEKSDNEWGYKNVYITQDKIKEILDHAAEF